MTTIAYKDGVMAADSRSTRNGTIVSERCCKIFKAKNGWLIGWTGSAPLIDKIKEWADGGCEGEPPAIPKNGDDTSSGLALIVKGDGSIWELDHHGVLDPVNGDFMAEGSGWEIAMGAMAAGKSAIEAVEVAKTLDIYTGGDVQSVRLDAGKVVYPPFGYGIGASSS